MQCPKCEGTMSKKSYGGQIAILRCDACFGIFTDQKTLGLMKDEWMADVVLDKGNPKTGKKYDKVDDIKCPVCDTKMDKIFDEEQPHIWLESCGSCTGLFLDAGEFTDLKNYTLMDVLRSLLPNNRA
jgi:Zn-finger nucleic acid-binding protein